MTTTTLWTYQYYMGSWIQLQTYAIENLLVARHFGACTWTKSWSSCSDEMAEETANDAWRDVNLVDVCGEGVNGFQKRFDGTIEGWLIYIRVLLLLVVSAMLGNRVSLLGAATLNGIPALRGTTYLISTSWHLLGLGTKALPWHQVAV